MPSTRWGRRGEGRGEEGNKRKGRGKSKGGKRRKRNFLFCRAREATFPVQEATAKKVYLGLFPTACFPAIRIFTLPLRTRRHRVFYWHEFQSHSLHCFFLISALRVSSKDPSSSFTEESEIFISVRTFMKIFIFRLCLYFHQFYFLLLCIKIFSASTSTSNWIVVDCFIETYWSINGTHLCLSERRKKLSDEKAQKAKMSESLSLKFQPDFRSTFAVILISCYLPSVEVKETRKRY